MAFVTPHASAGRGRCRWIHGYSALASGVTMFISNRGGGM